MISGIGLKSSLKSLDSDLGKVFSPSWTAHGSPATGNGALLLGIARTALRKIFALAYRMIRKRREKKSLGQNFHSLSPGGHFLCLASRICPQNLIGLGPISHLTAKIAMCFYTFLGTLPVCFQPLLSAFHFSAKTASVLILRDPLHVTSHRHKHPYTFDKKLHRTSW